MQPFTKSYCSVGLLQSYFNKDARFNKDSASESLQSLVDF